MILILSSVILFFPRLNKYKGGVTINELQSTSKAKIVVSQSGEFYPGSLLERIVVVSGSQAAVTHAQNLIWHRIAQLSESDEGTNDELLITGKLLIPTAASGLIIGRGGANIKSIGDASEARVQLSSKEEMNFTQERVMTVTGAVDACVSAVQMVIEKLMEDEEISQYVNPTTNYDRLLNSGMGMFGGGQGAPIASMGGQMYPSASYDRRRGGGGGGRSKIDTRIVDTLPGGAETISAQTTINMSVPDALVGCILGMRGSTVNEIMKLTTAKVTISPRSYTTLCLLLTPTAH